jgi:hypothetical protein
MYMYKESRTHIFSLRSHDQPRKVCCSSHLLLPSPLQLLEILDLEPEPPALVPIQAPVDLPHLDPHRPQALQPIQHVPLLLPRVRLRRLLPADLHVLDIGRGEPLTQLPHTLLDLGDARLRLDFARPAVALLGPQVDGHVQVPDGGGQVGRQDQVGAPRLVRPHVVVDDDVHGLRGRAVHHWQCLGADLPVKQEERWRERLRQADVGLQLPRVRAADGRARRGREEVQVDHLADLARHAEEGGKVGGRGGRRERRASWEGRGREGARVEGVLLKGLEGVAQALLGEGVDLILGEVQDPLEGKAIVGGGGGRGGRHAETFAWRGRGFPARRTLDMTFRGGHLRGQLGAS